MFKFIRLVIVFLIVTDFTSFAQQRNGYQSHSVLEYTLKEISGQNSSIISLKEIGKSAGGRSILAVEIGTGERSEKPALLVVAGAEPDDIAGTYAATEFIRSLTADSLKSLLARVTIYAIPRLSPDGAEGYFSIPKISLPGNSEADDADHDGANDEDGAEDLNADGQITMMRIIDPLGDWMLNPEDSALMKRADKRKGELGMYQLLTEGKDNDRDGKVNEDEIGGTNVNRNFTFKYKPYQTDGGNYPFSSPEARSLGEFLFAHNNILAVFTFEYYDNINESWKISTPEQQSGNNFAPDSVAYSQTAALLKKHLQYSYKAEPPAGDIAQWAYFHGGRLSFCAPAWMYPSIQTDTTKESPKKTSDYKKNSVDNEIRALRWIQNFAPQNFIQWKKYDHPDFTGMSVEIGGFAPFALHNPPADSLVSVVKGSVNLLTELAQLMPELIVESKKIEPLGNDIFRVTISITNIGKLPSHTVVGRQVRGLRPLQSRVELAPGQKILSGKAIQLFTEPLAPQATIQHTFLVLGKGDIHYTIGCPTTGFVKTKMSIK
ncbi:MAG: hypothetical protein JST20_08710 [Bacteroidetes bacterium]|nr:hypothetical protein [Bacteroidota bacterium]